MSVRGFGETLLSSVPGSSCRAISFLRVFFEDVADTINLPSTLFGWYANDFSLPPSRQTKLISCLRVGLRFNFYFSQFFEENTFTKLVNICFLICLLSFALKPISLLLDILSLETDRKSLCCFGK